MLPRPRGLSFQSESRRQPRCGTCLLLRPSRSWPALPCCSATGASGPRREPSAAGRATVGRVSRRHHHSGEARAAGRDYRRRPMVPTRRPHRIAVACALPLTTLACATAALAGGGNWAAPQIRIVTEHGVLGSSPATFSPQAPLSQAALADAIRATDALQQDAAPTAP